MLKLMATAVLFTSLVVPVADRPPRLDVEQTCRAAGKIAVAQQSYEQCMASERSALAKLEQVWNEFTPAEHSRCVSLTSIGGRPSYTEALVCLQMYREAAKLRSGGK